MISIIAGVLAYARRHRRQKMIRGSLKGAGIDEKNIISPSEAAKMAIERHERISMVDEFERAFPSEDYFKIEEEKEKLKTMIRSRIKPIEKIKDTSLDRDKIISLILVFILISMVGATINIVLNPVPSEKFTEFYILGPAGKAYDYPTDLKVGETGEVIIGVVNHEYQTMNYRIVIKLGEETIGNTTLTLKNGEKWEKRFEFTPTEAGDDQKLQFLLYRLPDENRVYRSLHLFINVKG